jgi:hypothetical protein
MKNKVRLAVAGAALAALTATGAGTAAYAHHAFAAEFDANRPVLLKGAVDFVEWTNPHTWIHISVKDVNKYGQPKAGSNLNWAIEGGQGLSAAEQAKARSVAIPKGTEVVVRGYQSKDTVCSRKWGTGAALKNITCKANGRDVTFPNGCKLFVGGSSTGAPKDGADAGARTDCTASSAPA